MNNIKVVNTVPNARVDYVRLVVQTSLVYVDVCRAAGGVVQIAICFCDQKQNGHLMNLRVSLTLQLYKLPSDSWIL